MSELEDLIREQADDMRHGNRLRRQGEPWMHAVVSLDQLGVDRLDSGGRLGRDRSEPWGCPIHERRHSALDSMGRPQCAECHREHMRAYTRSEKGKAQHKRYAERPEVRERRRQTAEARRRAKGIQPPYIKTPEEREEMLRQRAIRERARKKAYRARMKAAAQGVSPILGGV